MSHSPQSEARAIAFGTGSQATFFSNHSSQSPFEKLLEMPFSTLPFVESLVAGKELLIS
jgi:hypothetical protein